MLRLALLEMAGFVLCRRGAEGLGWGLPKKLRHPRHQHLLLRPAHRNVVEFRHASWWTEEVYSAFRKAGIIFCSCSGPRLPDELIRTADEIYVRLHGPKRWYRHDYSKEELKEWAERIKASGAERTWIYFNNDNEAHAPKNATALRRML